MSAFIKKKNDDGTENPRYVDLLEEDKAISGQSYVCVSFVSPEMLVVTTNVLESTVFGNK